jgi:hypothetical protein
VDCQESFQKDRNWLQVLIVRDVVLHKSAALETKVSLRLNGLIEDVARTHWQALVGVIGGAIIECYVNAEITLALWDRPSLKVALLSFRHLMIPDHHQVNFLKDFRNNLSLPS